MSEPPFDHEVEMFTLPSWEDTEYWERAIAAGLDGPIKLTQPNGDHPDHDSWQPLNLNQLEERPPLEPTLGGIGLLYPGKRHVWSGPQESAKTLAAYAAALNVIRDGGTVVVIDFEMGRYEARNRMRDLGYTPADIARVAYIEPDEPARSGTVNRLVALAPQLVIIDAAAGAYDNNQLDDNKRADVERFTTLYVRDFWKAGIATIVLDHVVKNTETRGNYAIGSERKVGGADVHLGFTCTVPIKRGTTGIYKITTHKDRGGYLQRGALANMHLTSDPDTHQIAWTFEPAEHHDPEDDFRPTTLMERVSRWLEQEGGWHSGRTIEKSVEGKGAFLRTAIKVLAREGFVTQKETGRGHEYHHAQTYRKSEDRVPEDTRNHAPSDRVPTASHRVPDADDYDCVPRPPPIRGDAGTRSESNRVPTDPERTASRIDVTDPDIQRLLDE